jgi:hypothetical protein
MYQLPTPSSIWTYCQISDFRRRVFIAVYHTWGLQHPNRRNVRYDSGTAIEQLSHRYGWERNCEEDRLVNRVATGLPKCPYTKADMQCCFQVSDDAYHPYSAVALFAASAVMSPVWNRKRCVTKTIILGGLNKHNSPTSDRWRKQFSTACRSM